MFTHSGVHMTLTSGAPTIHDVAYHLSRIPRWAGGTNEPWTVLQHSLVMYDLVAKGKKGLPGDGARGQDIAAWDPEQAKKSKQITKPTRIPWGPELYLWALWHDAHEMVTEDIPPPFKTSEQRAIQDELDRRFYRETLGVPFPANDVLCAVEWLDGVMATAEAYMLCHPDVRLYFPEPDSTAITAIRNRLWKIPLSMVTAFERITHRLLKEIHS